jgi:hypothetical protein
MGFTDLPEYQALVTAVTATKGAEESGTVALNGLGAYIEANKANPAALQTLADTLQKPTVDLAAAIAANPIPA